MRTTRRTILGATVGAIALSGCTGSDDGAEVSSPADGTESEMANDGGGDAYGGENGAQTADGGNDNAEGGDDEPEGATESDAGRATVQVRSHAEHGDVLVGPDELTLYMFTQDTQDDGASACYDDCAAAWPPLEADDPVAGEDVTAELTGFEREDGAPHVAARGWPLYYFAQDEAPGDARGQGVNDAWWVLRPDGTPVRPDGEEQSDD